MRIQGGQALVGGQFVAADVAFEEADGKISAVGAEGGNGQKGVAEDLAGADEDRHGCGVH